MNVRNFFLTLLLVFLTVECATVSADPGFFDDWKSPTASPPSRPLFAKTRSFLDSVKDSFKRTKEKLKETSDKLKHALVDKPFQFLQSMLVGDDDGHQSANVSPVATTVKTTPTASGKSVLHHVTTGPYKSSTPPKVQGRNQNDDDAPAQLAAPPTASETPEPAPPSDPAPTSTPTPTPIPSAPKPQVRNVVGDSIPESVATISVGAPSMLPASSDRSSDDAMENAQVPASGTGRSRRGSSSREDDQIVQTVRFTNGTETDVEVPTGKSADDVVPMDAVVVGAPRRSSEEANSGPLAPSKSSADSNNSGWIAGMAVGVLALVVSMVVAGLLYRRRRLQKERDSEFSEVAPLTPPPLISVHGDRNTASRVNAVEDSWEQYMADISRRHEASEAPAAPGTNVSAPNSTVPALAAAAKEERTHADEEQERIRSLNIYLRDVTALAHSKDRLNIPSVTSSGSSGLGVNSPSPFSQRDSYGSFETYE